MKPVLYALVAMFSYAIANVLLELKFSKANTFTLVASYASVIVILAFIGRYITKTEDPSFNWPSGETLGLVVVLGLLMAAGDYFYVGAYTAGGSLMTVASIVAMFPVFASIVKFFATGSVPTRWHMAGYACAALAVFLVSKGSSLQK